jgi:hypothetical protein
MKLVDISPRSQALRPGARRTSRRPLLSALALLVAVLASAACSGESSGIPRLAVVFDGAHCTYDGPDRVSAGDIQVSFANDGDDPAGLSFLRLPIGMAVDPGVGADGPITSPEPQDGVEVVGVVEVDAGEDGDELAALTSGTHVLDCVTFGPDGPDHFWRGAVLDVDR